MLRASQGGLSEVRRTNDTISIPQEEVLVKWESVASIADAIWIRESGAIAKKKPRR
jgi:hypothetical protein